MKVKLRQQSITIDAPRSAVFELISSFGGVEDPSGRPIWLFAWEQQRRQKAGGAGQQ